MKDRATQSPMWKFKVIERIPYILMDPKNIFGGFTSTNLEPFKGRPFHLSQILK